MRCTLPILLLLCSCATVEDRQPEDQRNTDILGKWVSLDADECWYPLIEYFKDKTKIVKISYCDENGDIAKEWYKSEWMIEGPIIIETTIDGSDEITSSFSLPHIEKDSLDYLDADKLVITDDRQTSIYVRPNK